VDAIQRASAYRDSDHLRIEQPIAFRMLRRILDRDQVSPAYLLAGAPGLGRREAALWFAMGLLCSREPNSERPCGECPNCTLGSSNHPDIHILQRNTNRATIGIEDVRNRIREPLSRRAFAGGRKIVVIPEAERMTPQAQNALLKILEDPVGQSTLLLIAPGVGYMLPTVRSRCVTVPFRSLGIEGFRRRMEDSIPDAEDAADLFTRSGGDIATAREMLSEDGAREWQSMAQLVDSLLEGGLSPAQISNWSDKLGGDPERTEILLDGISLTIRHAMIGDRVLPAHYARAVGILTRTGEILRANGNRRLAWEVCLIKLQATLH